MIQHCKTFIRNPTDIYCGFDRDDLIWRDSHFERLKYAPLFFDSQYRLFDRTKVQFKKKIHTPGFHLPIWKLPMWPKWHAPSKARIYHVNRIFMSAKERQTKMQRYNNAGQAAQFDQWNRRDENSFSWRSFMDTEFTKTFRDWFSNKSAIEIATR